MRPILGVDLGTANTLACTHKGIVWQEPTVVAMEKNKHQVVALGTQAKVMMGRVHDRFETIRPVHGGTVADMAASSAIIRHLIGLVSGRMWLKPQVVMAADPHTSEAARHALAEVVYSSGAREVLMMSTPVAAALGSDLPVEKPHGLLLVDVGGGTTDASVLSLGNVVVSASTETAGDALDQHVIEYLRKAYDLVIGEGTAERLKIEVGWATPPLEQKSVVSGRCTRNGLPQQISIPAREVHDALQPGLEEIKAVVLKVLAQTPPELLGDIAEEGIWLTGGGSLLRGLDQFLGGELDMPVHMVPDPLRAVVLGTGRALKNPRAFGLKAMPR